MNQISMEIGIRAIDFIQISAGFLLTMLCFFGAPRKRVLNKFLLVSFGLQCMLFVVFHDGLRVKVLAFLMLLSTLTIEFVVGKKRDLIANDR